MSSLGILSNLAWSISTDFLLERSGSGCEGYIVDWREACPVDCTALVVEGGASKPSTCKAGCQHYGVQLVFVFFYDRLSAYEAQNVIAKEVAFVRHLSFGSKSVTLRSLWVLIFAFLIRKL